MPLRLPGAVTLCATLRCVTALRLITALDYPYVAARDFTLLPLPHVRCRLVVVGCIYERSCIPSFTLPLPYVACFTLPFTLVAVAGCHFCPRTRSHFTLIYVAADLPLPVATTLIRCGFYVYRSLLVESLRFCTARCGFYVTFTFTFLRFYVFAGTSFVHFSSSISTLPAELTMRDLLILLVRRRQLLWCCCWLAHAIFTSRG